MKILLENEQVLVKYSEEQNGMREHISFVNKLDLINDTKGFTRNVRGIKTAVKFIEHLSTVEELKHDLNFSDVIGILSEKFNLAPHTYCGLD